MNRHRYEAMDTKNLNIPYRIPNESTNRICILASPSDENGQTMRVGVSDDDGNIYSCNKIDLEQKTTIHFHVF